MKDVFSRKEAENVSDWIEIRAIVSVSSKDHFVKQLEQIVESVRTSRTKTEKRQHEEKFKRDHLNAQLSQLIEKARQYAKVLKDFQEVKFFVIRPSSAYPLSLSFRLSEKMNCLLQNPNKTCVCVCVFFIFTIVRSMKKIYSNERLFLEHV